MSAEQSLTDFSELDPEDVEQALRYAAAAVDERQLPVIEGA